MKQSSANSILTDIHLWVPVAALVLGIVLLVILR